MNNLKINSVEKETIEEAKQRYAELTYVYPLEKAKTFDKEPQMELLKRQFELGTKWQQEQDKKLFDEYNQYTMDCIEVELTRPLPFNKWFEQFRYR
jgi:hypothetical protein